MNYRIIGACPFGTQEMDEQGRMDTTQFCTDDPELYEFGTGARLAIIVAQNYGAKPVCGIEIDLGIIEVYDLVTGFGIRVAYNNGWYSVSNIVYRNTVSPIALVKVARQMWEEKNHG